MSCFPMQSVPPAGQMVDLFSPGNTSASQASPGMLTQTQRAARHALCLSAMQETDVIKHLDCF